MLCARETMVGAFALEGRNAVQGDHPISLTLGWRAHSLHRMWREGIELEGVLHASGFADHAATVGRLTMPSAGCVRYQLTFEANDGTPHRFDGTKQLSLSGVPAGLSVVRGRLLTGHGEPVGRALFRFDLQHDLLDFLRSIERRV